MLEKLPKQILLIPCFGIGVFLILYTIAACQYPGGSSFDLTQKGFSIMNNYWCDLLEKEAYNGAFNKGRITAIFAMSFLIVSLIVMWFFIPKLFSRKNINHKIIQFTGISAMIIALFLVTPHHGWVINTSGILGSFAILFTFIELKKEGHHFLFRYAMFCLVLCFINYSIYYTKMGLFMLPFIQKLTFLIVFIWSGMLSYKMYQLSKWMEK